MNLLRQFSNRMLTHNAALLVLGLVWVYFNYIMAMGVISASIPLMIGVILFVCFVVYNATTVWLFKVSLERQRDITYYLARHLKLDH